jgi:uncharacterized protein
VPEKSDLPVDVSPPEPVERPMLYQSWNLSTWLHWAYEPEVVQRLLPAGLEVDTWEGRAWVGLVPFVIEGQRPAGLPRLPWLSRAHETHFRTYCTAPDGTSGSYFIYLENDLLPGVAAGRLGFRLNYVWSSLSLRRDGDRFTYRGRRLLPPGAAHEIRVEVGAPYAEDEPSALEHFVTAQWVLFTRYGPRLAAVQVEHPPWPLRRAGFLGMEGNLFEAAGIPRPEGETMVHFSPGVPSRIAFPRWIR